MINNRQNGRRRGRGGGQRPPNSMPSQGNRQDNRSRGNAAQLYEKYKAMARDTQLAGDRVQTEYYLQFADHYFRVLNESRARFEEQRRPSRDDYMSDEDEDQDQDEAMGAEGEQQQRHSGDSDEHDERQDYEPAREARNGGERRPRRERGRRERNGEPERNGEARDSAGEERISIEALPPPIAIEGGEAPAKAPRRRTRRPREDEADIAPAA